MRRRLHLWIAAAIVAYALSAAFGFAAPANKGPVYDHLTGAAACRVSSDGVVW